MAKNKYRAVKNGDWYEVTSSDGPTEKPLVLCASATDAEWIAHALDLRERIDGASNIKPLSDQVFVKPVQKRKSGNIIVPDKRLSELWSGIVVAVGPGKSDKAGGFTPMQVKVGDYVWFSWDNSRTEVNGEEYLTMHETSILCVVD